jgi:hypothetical protein
MATTMRPSPFENPFGARPSARSLCAAALAGCLLLVTSAAQADPAPAPAAPIAFGDRFFRGTTPGELSAPKVLVVSTLYAASLASGIVGVASLISASNQGDEAEEYKSEQAPGFCNEIASGACTGYRGLLDEERELRTTGFALLGVSGLSIVAAALTAELWPNETSQPNVALALDANGAGLTAFGSF